MRSNGWIKVAVPAIAIVLLVALIGSRFDCVALGTLGEWVGGVAGAVALMVAIQELHSQATYRRDSETAERTAEARRVALQLRHAPTSANGHLRVRIRNHGSSPIHQAVLVIRFRSDQPSPSVTLHEPSRYEEYGVRLADEGADGFIATVLLSTVFSGETPGVIFDCPGVDRFEAVLDWVDAYDQPRWVWTDGVETAFGDGQRTAIPEAH